MSALVAPKLGFQRATATVERGPVDEQLTKKMSRSGVEAARRKFTPEFMNRLDKVIVFHPLRAAELQRIVDIELSGVQQRVHEMARGAFLFTVSDAGKQFLLDEGTDSRYGARHLKRAIERLVVQPLSNLIASEQVRAGDLVSIDHEREAPDMTFRLLREGIPAEEVAAGTTAAANAGWYGAEAA
jgi:ATP-dependent Clp protease ATP-binding subunit ClpA